MAHHILKNIANELGFLFLLIPRLEALVELLQKLSVVLIEAVHIGEDNAKIRLFRELLAELPIAENVVQRLFVDLVQQCCSEGEGDGGRSGVAKKPLEIFEPREVSQGTLINSKSFST